ncbi:hypothetical protein F5Y18DRAFT_397038 [Xylariaceae sp. FL1019]|nr:hypothetical protein F5Y18DRAFT_397038 [Xylariaceae sp. FL1019]
MPLSTQYSMRDLLTRSKDCRLCALFLKVADRRGDFESSSDIIRFDKVQSSLIMNSAGRPVLTICRTSGKLKRPVIPKPI